MLRYLYILMMVMFSLPVLGEQMPPWIDGHRRELLYSSDDYLTGFAENVMKKGEDVDEKMELLKKSAQANLIESIRVKIESENQSRVRQSLNISNHKVKENFSEMFDAAIKTTANAEIVGLKTESYHNKTNNKIYAIAYVRRNEQIIYYQNNLRQNIAQAESFLNSAKQCETNKLKIKAREQCRKIIPLLAQISYFQEMLTTLDKNTTEQMLLTATSERLRNEVMLLMVLLEQNVYIHITSEENNLGKSEFLLTNKLKSLLASNGCSFVDNPLHSDFRLEITAATRKHDVDNPDFKFSHADIQVNLYSTFHQKNIYTDVVSTKGGGMSYESAGKKALEEGAGQVWDKIKVWIAE